MLYSDSGILTYFGEFRDGTKNGSGVEYYYTGGKLYEGSYEDNAWEGHGCWYNIIEEIIYKGYFNKGNPIKNSKVYIKRSDSALKYKNSATKLSTIFHEERKKKVNTE